MDKSVFRIMKFLLPAALLLGACQQDELYHVPGSLEPGKALTLTFSSDPMEQYKVTTRSSDAKEDAEKEIKTLHIFFFDSEGNWLEGSYLTGYTGTTGAIEYGGYIAPSQGATLLKIDRQGFSDPNAAGTATVYAVANVEPSLFGELDEVTKRPVALDKEGLTPQAALEALVYRPSQFIFTVLPETGMPMIGHKTIDLTAETASNDEERIVELQALMARIDVDLQIDSETSDGNLPRMLLTSWTACNLPTQVSFTPTERGNSTSLSEDGMKRDETQRTTQYIYNRQGSIELSFYMFENMQQPNGTPQYPAGIEEYQKQRYKPTIAHEDAAHIVFDTQYTTYNNATYTVRYTLYLGHNHTDDFEVIRNHQYKNNITIKGLTSQETVGNGSKYTYDARVNIDDSTDNKYYISILRERNHDAHFCVTPMDVYLFDESAVPSMVIEFMDGSDLDDGQPWIRMERMPAENMQNGTLPQGMSEDDHLIEGSNFTAGHGKRRYFTTDLVTNTLAQTGASVTIENSRDRVYFYIDENLSDSEDRTAKLKLTYYENGSPVAGEERTLEITQTHFLKVQVYDREGNRPDYSNPYPDDNSYGGEDGVIYMEQYEEYLDHYDPLDNHSQPEQIYLGLSWGDNLMGRSVSDYDNYVAGLSNTANIVEALPQETMTLNEKPLSAASYCYNRNKREEDGSVYHERTWEGGLIGGHYVYKTNRKYFLPGIRQMEDALTQYYTMFPEFQGNYYWSSAAGRRRGAFGIVTDDRERARATLVNEDGSYAESSEDYPYESGKGGSAYRTEVLRIRAFRCDLEPLQY